MHPHEEAIVRAFVEPSSRARWLEALDSAKRRPAFLNRLDHCRDLDDRFARPLPWSTNVVALLASLGAPAEAYVLSGLDDLDGRELPLAEAVDRAEAGGFGTILGCIPGRLACYLDEAGSRRRLLLVRDGA